MELLKPEGVAFRSMTLLRALYVPLMFLLSTDDCNRDGQNLTENV